MGTVAIVDLRLLGLGMRHQSSAQLVRDTTPWTLIGLVIMLISGPLIFSSNPVFYLSNGAFPYYTFREDVSIAGIPIFMTRLGYTAELGYELWVDVDRALDLWDALVDAGAPSGMRVIGMTALDLFRIEGGFIIGGVHE